MTPAARAPVVLGLVWLAAGCSSESEKPPSQLVDGTKVAEPAVRVDAPRPQILTRVASTSVNRATLGTPAGECLRAAREHAAKGPIVVRIGVSGLSVTFRTDSRRTLVACDGSHAIGTHERSWCGRAYGRLEMARLLDPRLDLAGCQTSAGDTIAFAWFEPGRDAAYLGVRQDGYTEIYPVAGRLPVRVTTRAVAPDRSGATFEISEHSATGLLLRSSTLEARVAG